MERGQKNPPPNSFRAPTRVLRENFEMLSKRIGVVEEQKPETGRDAFFCRRNLQPFPQGDRDKWRMRHTRDVYAIRFSLLSLHGDPRKAGEQSPLGIHTRLAARRRAEAEDTSTFVLRSGTTDCSLSSSSWPLYPKFATSWLRTAARTLQSQTADRRPQTTQSQTAWPWCWFGGAAKSAKTAGGVHKKCVDLYSFLRTNCTMEV